MGTGIHGVTVTMEERKAGLWLVKPYNFDVVWTPVWVTPKYEGVAQHICLFSGTKLPLDSVAVWGRWVDTGPDAITYRGR